MRRRRIGGALLLAICVVLLGVGPGRGEEPPLSPDDDSVGDTPLATPQPVISLGTSSAYVVPAPRTLPQVLLGAETLEVSSAIDDFLSVSEGVAGALLYRPDTGAVLAINADEAFPLASVSKVYILVAYLDALSHEERTPDEIESYLLEAMIEWSDNDAATALWYAFGGGAALQDFLSAKGLPPVGIPEVEDWGDVTASPREVAQLLTRLATGDLLDAESTQTALNLLGQVDASQRWGVTAGLEASTAASMALKDGWYPGDEGWRVNSAGIVIPGDGAPGYVLVTLSDGQPTFEYGVETIETIALLANASMQRAP